MENTGGSPLATILAAHLRDAREELTGRWLERISSRVTLEPGKVFPSEGLLDHVPRLLLGIADYVESPAQAIGADDAVIAKARELGELRHTQGFGAHEILKEYEILGGILFAFFVRIVDDIDASCTRGELLGCAQRLFHAVALVQEATANRFLERMQQQVTDREERLRAFNRTLMHELRNRIGATLGAGEMLRIPEIAEDRRRALRDVVVRSAHEMQVVMENLLELSRVEGSVAPQRHVMLREAAADAVRQLRDMAQDAGVEVRLAPKLPDIEVNAAAVELCLTNLVSNGIKYADPAKSERWVEVNGYLLPEGAQVASATDLVVTVRSNGIPVPESERENLFRRFFRTADAASSAVKGTGLGLSIVRATVEDLGGRAWVEFPDGGAVFSFSFPLNA